ncbi:MAG: CDP-alcohol phosphatidyltransferase family protein [Isosphaeraceae bacterium]
MSQRHPTLAELREVVQKQRHREIGNWLARRIARPTAVYGTWMAVRLGLSANQVTLASLGASLAGASAIGSGSRLGFVAGTALLHLGFWLDHVDGQVARWRRTASLGGVYLDYLMHHLVNLALGYALGFGLAIRSGSPLWSVAGFAIAAGWGLLSLHNDCRYKAFFQRLKSVSGSYRVEGGSGGRPALPAPWPRSGLGMFTWPAYKLCEPHAVLLSVTGLAVIAVLNASFWMICWQVAVLGMALLAPLLASARIARAVTRGTVEAEFDRWFQPAEVGRAPLLPSARGGRVPTNR